MAEEKVYKAQELCNYSNLRIVSMIPGDLKKLPDVYIFSKIFRSVV